MKHLSFFLLLMLSTSGFSQLKFADIFTDHMVLQRDAPVRLWGTASKGEPVAIHLLGETHTATLKEDCSWYIELGTLQMSDTPINITLVQGDERQQLNNVLVGDVWLLLGQSNMEWPMQSEAHYEQEIAHAENSLLRFYNPSYIGKNIYAQPYTEEQNRALQAKKMHSGTWEQSDPQSFKSMSAVGYYFGKALAENTQVPIGLINLSVGGAPIETFIDSTALARSRFKEKVRGNWLENPHLPEWIRQRGAENVGHGNLNHAFRPGFIYQTGIAPITEFPITGILWYQGESNAQEIPRVEEYQQLQDLMVRDLRSKWESPDMPFYYVQLSSIDTLNYKSNYWPEMRYQQLRSLKTLPRSGMAVSLDKGAKNDVHPRNKKIIGQRLARWALRDVYQESIEVSGPLPQQARFVADGILLSFTHGSGLKTADGESLRGFSIDGKPVSARIVDEGVLIETRLRPDSLQYAWEPYSDANLVNAQELPAPTFRIQVDQ